MTLFKEEALTEFTRADWLRVTGFNTIIALFLTAINFGPGFLVNFIFSQCIGLAMTWSIRKALRLTKDYSPLIQLSGLLAAMLVAVCIGALAAALVTASYTGRFTLERQPTTLAIILFSILFASIITYIFLSRERIRVTYSVEINQELLNHPLPPLLLQPLVENSIRHGLELSTTGGEIMIRGKKIDDSLLLAVTDTGTGMNQNSTPGVGLANIRDRLASLYGEAGTLTITENRPSGIIATIEIPYATH